VDTADGGARPPHATALDPQAPLVLVSSDTHIGPRLREDLRDYCPTHYLSAFDELVAEHETARAARAAASAGFTRHPNQLTAGHYDVRARLHDMDRDGIAAEVIFHGSQNFEPIPFLPQLLGNDATFSFDRDLAPVGLRIYNEWLADFCAVEPARHVGLGHVPMWDVAAACAQLETVADSGLRGINFPALRHGVYLEYNDRAWDPFWDECAARGLALCTHVGAASPGRASGPESLALTSIEDGGYFARRAIWWMAFGGVFERFPDLTLVITESPGDWWPYTMTELDSAWLAMAELNPALREQVPRLPSEYCAQNVFVGASFLASFEAERAVRERYSSQLMWGSDYPHIESTWQYTDDETDEPVTRLALRNTFAGLPATDTRAVIGQTAIRVFGLDQTELTRVAAHIGAPTLDELEQPIDSVPLGASPTAFRTLGPGAEVYPRPNSWYDTSSRSRRDVSATPSNEPGGNGIAVMRSVTYSRWSIAQWPSRLDQRSR
jgi:predicted TIM-barrel fold metal-dependent hydrolase